MKRKAPLVFAMLLLLGAAAWPAAAQGLLPAAFGGWTNSGAETQTPAAQIDQLLHDQANIIREYGITAAERRDYGHGTESTTVTLYRMVDPTAAFGAFTFLRDPQMTPLPSGSAAAYTAGAHDRALMVVGNFVLDVSAAKERPMDADLKELAAILFPHADGRPFPVIAGYLPKAGLVPGSERYVLGPQALAQVFPTDVKQRDWVGFNRSAEAIVAHYHLAGEPKDKDIVLLVALYPTQQVAANQYDAISKAVALNIDSSQTNGQPAVFGTRSSALVAILTGVDSRQAASDFLGQIHYVSAVTWNEPTHELTDPTIGTIVVGAILGTGTIMVLAIAAGLGFGGFRLLIKLLLPGKIFDSEDRVEIIQLGLSAKPIRAKDFYA